MTDSNMSKQHRPLQILETLAAMGFEGHSVEDIAEESRLTYSSTRRALLVLEHAGWIVETPASGTAKRLWKPSDKLIKVAFQYKQFCQNQVHSIQKNYLATTGEALSNG